jgi:radical SAM protein with 4Fe4S-binding SPASM domain
MPCRGGGGSHRFEFTREEISEAVRASGLLELEVEIGPGCSLHRPLGSAPGDPAAAEELSEAEIREIILQARDLGVKGITLFAAPENPQPELPGLCRFVESQGLEVEVSTEIPGIEPGRCGRASDPAAETCGDGCMRHRYSCLVCPCGDVVPCAGLDLSIGNVRNRTLSEILEDSEVLEDLRDHLHTIKGPCASCEDAEVCYGCRGAAYRLTGDYLASDPLCWKNADRQDEIARLPFAVEAIIPHEKPMRIVDRLEKIGERSGEVSVTVSEEILFVGEGDVVDETAYLEMMAQSVAALDGFKRLGRPHPALAGFLVGAQKLEILGPARVGERLNIHLYKQTRFGGFGILEGSVTRDGVVLARGEVKIWQDAG